MENQNVVSIAVRMEKRDYLDLWRASPVRRISWILIPIGLFYLYWAFAVFMNEGYTEQTASTILQFCFVSCLALVGVVAVPRLRTRLAFRGPMFRDTRTFSVSEQGVNCDSELFNGLYRWGAFTAIRETKKSFVFFFSSVAAILIPKRCLATQDDLVRLREMVAKHFSGKKVLRS
jgi:hypothetical protein